MTEEMSRAPVSGAIQNLFGAGDENVRLLESLLGVRIALRGGEITVEGDEEQAVDTARRAADHEGNQHADECAHAHDALAAEVEDAAALVDRLTQRRQQQRAGKRNADREEQDDEVEHIRRPPFDAAGRGLCAARGPSDTGWR